MASMAAWLLSVVADGTQRHQGQRSVCAPPKILVLGGRLHPHLLRRISAHVGEEAAVFGGRNQFCLQEVIAFTFVPFSAWQRHKLTIKNKQPIMCSDVLLENLPMWLQFVDRSGSTVCGESYRICHIEGKQSALEISSVSIHEHPLFFFFSFMYMFTAMFLLMLHLKCVWTCGPLRVWMRHRMVEHVFISNNNQSPAADAWFGSERDLVHPNYRKKTLYSHVLLRIEPCWFWVYLHMFWEFYIGDFFPSQSLLWLDYVLWEKVVPIKTGESLLNYAK